MTVLLTNVKCIRIELGKILYKGTVTCILYIILVFLYRLMKTPSYLALKEHLTLLFMIILMLLLIMALLAPFEPLFPTPLLNGWVGWGEGEEVI